jgi:beta-N-acetylhexosaminidase
MILGMGTVAVAAAAAAVASPSPAQVPHSPAKLLGQRIMVGVPGTSPGASLLAQVKAGQVGAVILYAYNISSDRQVSALTSSLQQAARAGGNPPLLIAIDQEGGQVKRFPNGPPFLSPPQIVAGGNPKVAFDQGWMTGRYLRSRGINLNLAPVLDVPTSGGAFIWREGRAFSFSANTVSSYGGAFARGMQSAGIAAAAKHFPGLGSATINTDNQLIELHPTRGQRAAALAPYQALFPNTLDAVVVSTAGFPAYDPTGAPAALSSPIISGLLRARLGFAGVVMTDALGVPTGHSEIDGAVLAARAGADLLLNMDSASGELAALESALRSGRIGRAQAVASYERIIALKQRLASTH